MRKHNSFREALVAALPVLAREKDRLAVWIDRGTIAVRLGTVDQDGNTGFEYRYRLNAILLDFADEPTKVFATAVEWLRAQQPELLLKRENDEAFSFEVEVLDDRKVDIQIQIDLNEAVDIGPAGQISHRPEPEIAEGVVAGLIEVPIGTTLEQVDVNGQALP